MARHILRPLTLTLRLAEWQDLVGAMAPIPAVLLANLALRERWAWFANQALAAAAILAAGGAGLATLATDRSRAGPGAILLIAALAATPFLFRRPRELAGRLLPLDPASPVTMLAMVGVVLLVGLQLQYQAGTDALAAIGRSPQVRPVDILVQELPLLLIALFSVGWLTRRSNGAVLARLGVVRPAWWQLTCGLAIAGLFFAVTQGAEHLQEAIDPMQARRLSQATGHYYAGISGAVGVAAIALAPAIAEEGLFRGALQPRLGILVAALAFAAMHSQYGLTVDTLLVFTLGAGLGLVRRHLNTTTAMVTHAGYNAVAAIGLTSSLLTVAGIAEAGLVVATLALLQLTRNSRPRSGAG